MYRRYILIRVFKSTKKIILKCTFHETSGKETERFLIFYVMFVFTLDSLQNLIERKVQKHLKCVVKSLQGNCL